MSSAYSLPPNFERLKRERLERLKKRFQNNLEDVELDLAVFDQKIMEYNKRLDQLRNKIYLTTHLPSKEEYEARYDEIKKERAVAYSKYLGFKNDVSTIVSNIDELDLILNGLVEVVELYDE